MEFPLQIYCQKDLGTYPYLKTYLEAVLFTYRINQLPHEVKEFIHIDIPCLILVDEIDDKTLEKISFAIPSNELAIIYHRKRCNKKIADGAHLFKGHKEENYERALWTILQYYLQRKTKKSSSNINEKNGIVSSEKFRKTMQLAQRVANIDCPACIIGETGTGKELVARTIHYQSARRDNPFIPVNCGAFNDELILSEFFGHTKGAFTGANQARKGLVELAEGGTLFLDELDSLTPKAQVILLRFLQEHEYRPVGAEKIKKSNVRVIAACNKDLLGLSKVGLFREDLLYRINIITIEVPPLIERKEDILLLSQLFLSRLSQIQDQQQKILEPGLLYFMLNHRWPGNVRELENFIYKAYYLSTKNIIQGKDLDIEVQKISPDGFQLNSERLKGFKEEKTSLIKRFEYEYICKVLEKSHGNISLASRTAKKERAAFFKLMKKYNISKEIYALNLKAKVDSNPTLG